MRRERSHGGSAISLLDVRDGAARHEVQLRSRGWGAFASRLRGEGTEARRAWQAGYVRRTVLADAACAALAGLAGYQVRFGAPSAGAGAASLAVMAALPLVWVLAMLVARAYEQRFLWVGAEEFRRVFGAAVMMLAAVGTVSWAFKMEVARGFVVVSLPLVTGLTLL